MDDGGNRMSRCRGVLSRQVLTCDTIEKSGMAALHTGRVTAAFTSSVMTPGHDGGGKDCSYSVGKGSSGAGSQR